jgi:hypothetical protein
MWSVHTSRTLILSYIIQLGLLSAIQQSKLSSIIYSAFDRLCCPLNATTMNAECLGYTCFVLLFKGLLKQAQVKLYDPPKSLGQVV